ncbi:MAG: Ldh family oxidoreductase [Candidatus Promineifilaceae bacterium]
MITISAEQLTKFIERIFVAAGASAENAQTVAHSLVWANLTGHDSHGVVRTVQYLEAIDTENIFPTAQPAVASESGATAQIDGNSTFGQVVAKFAMQHAIELGKTHGIAGVTLFNSHHIGRVGEWVEMAAEQNLAAIAFCNVASRRGRVAPHGGMESLLGTNPFAAAVPIEGREPFLLDYATSVVAEGKVRVARIAGKSIPEGWILNSNGEPSTDPHDLYTGGVLKSMGAYKGFGLGLLVELLGGVLSATGWPSLEEGQRMRNGALFIVLDIDRFRPIQAFLTDSATLFDKTKAIKPTPDNDEVLVPGEPEQHTYAERITNGVPLHDAAWQQLVDAAEKLAVPLPNHLKT